MAEENNQVTESWMDGLTSDELKSSESLKQFNDLDSLAKGYNDLKAYQGSSLRIPGEDAGDEARTEFNQKVLDQVPGLMVRPDFNNEDLSTDFYKSLGMPEASDGYGFPEVEGIKVPEERSKALSEIAHEFGLTKKQFNGFMEKALALDVQGMSANEDASKQNMETLRDSLGYAFTETLAEAEKVRVGFFPQIAADQMDPDTIKSFASIAKQLGKETVNLAGEAGKAPAILSPDLAKEKISEVNANPKHPYWVADHPDHQDAVQRMLDFMRLAHPEKAA